MGFDVVGMGARSAQSIESFREARRQLESPLLRIKRMGRFARNRGEKVSLLNLFARTIRVVKHYVVWVDEVYREEPGLPLNCQLASLATQPVCRHCGNDAVVEITALGVGDDITDAEVVRKAVRFHLLRKG